MNCGYDLHFSSGFAPQMPHTPPSFCKNALLLLQVPANLPSFFTKILIAIPATASAMSTMERSTNVIIEFTKNLPETLSMNYAFNLSLKSRSFSFSVSFAISYPASACRITPIPGSLRSTRFKRCSASSVPSATITIPA